MKTDPYLLNMIDYVMMGHNRIEHTKNL